MSKFLAALVVAAIIAILPIIITGLLDAANLALWLRLLSRRIGVDRATISTEEVYIPDSVKSGFYPIWLVGLGIILVGMFFLMPLSEIFNSEALRQVAAIVIGAPFLVALLLIVSRVFIDARVSGQHHSRMQIEAEESARKERIDGKIELLSEGIDRGEGNSLLNLYRRLWRAAYRTELITSTALGQPFFDVSMVSEINSDLEYVENSMQADKYLLKAASREKKRLAKTAIKTAVCPGCNKTLGFSVAAMKDKAAFSKEHKEVCLFCNATLVFKTKNFQIVSREAKRIFSKQGKDATVNTEAVPIADERRIPCTQCGAMVLPATAERNKGLCTPCKKKQKNK